MLTLTAVIILGLSACVGVQSPTPAPPANQLPTAYIDSISPTEACVENIVSFQGYGIDPDGQIVAYMWRSSMDGHLSTLASFETSSLSVGNHTIFFQVQDNNGVWSSETRCALKITEVVVTPPPPAPSTTPTRACPRAKTLEDLITCIKAQMPSRYSEGFVVPPEHVQSDWHSVVAQMLDGQSDDITLPSSLSTVYSVTTFTDTDNGRSYCVLMETGDIDNDGVVDRGWGTFIVDREATKELSIQIAHPKFDIGTADQGIGVFKGTSSRSFLMAGTHRYANGASSTCQPSFLQADAAHSDETLFYVTVRELVEFYDVAVGQLPAQGSFVAIQFHGMGSSNCPSVDVYMTYGVNSRPAPGDKLLDLQASLERHHPDWVVTVPGDSPRCGLHGSKNVPGRLLNNVAAANLCTTAASTDSGRFIHIEQKRDCRDPNDWIATVNEVFPATASVPAGQ